MIFPSNALILSCLTLTKHSWLNWALSFECWYSAEDSGVPVSRAIREDCPMEHLGHRWVFQ